MKQDTIYAGAPTDNTEGGKSYCPQNGSAITVDLNTAIAPFGYDLWSIESITGTAQGRASQKYRIDVSLVDSPSFVTLFSENEINFVTDIYTGEMKVRTAAPPSAPLARHVDQIRFTFFDAGTLGINMYREIDVFGVASVPEPSGIVLLGAGLLGLVLWKRRWPAAK